MGGRCMGGVWEVYGTCFTTPHVAPRPLYKGDAEDDVRSRRFLRIGAEKRVCHKSQVSSAQASCLP